MVGGAEEFGGWVQADEGVDVDDNWAGVVSEAEACEVRPHCPKERVVERASGVERLEAADRKGGNGKESDVSIM